MLIYSFIENFFFYLLTLQYCIGFAIYQHESATGIHVFSILNPPPSSLPVPSLWVVPVHQPRASIIMHRTWTGDSFHIWYYTCFNAILPNHPPPPQSPKDCCIHHCPFCCLVYMEFRKMVTITLYIRQKVFLKVLFCTCSVSDAVFCLVFRVEHNNPILSWNSVLTGQTRRR